MIIDQLIQNKGGPAALAEAVTLLKSATNPVIVAGGGVVMSAGVDEVVKLAETLQVELIFFRCGSKHLNNLALS